MNEPTVLIVDDDPPILQLLSMYLNRWGYQVTSASSGEEALDLYRTHPFDIILCDWEMPGMKGPELCQHIRRIESDRYTYIFLLTVKNADENIVHGIEAGADDYVTKPLSGPVLKVRLEAGKRLLSLERSLAETNTRLTNGLNRAALTLKSMLPPRSDGPVVSFDWLFRPCSFVGGDLFNASMLDDNLFSFYIVDVSGHGFESALFAVTIGNMLRPRNKIASLRGDNNINRNHWIDSPAKVAEVLNERFPLEAPDNIYFTMFYAVFDRRDLTLRWVRAGHPPPIIDRQGELIELSTGDPPIGFFEGHEYTEYTTQLKQDDRLFLYSDGVTELANPELDMFGLRQLRKTIQGTTGASLTQTMCHLDHTLADFCNVREPADDISLLGLQIL